jgi:hypothetical protein
MKSLFVAGAALLVFSSGAVAQTRTLQQNTMPAPKIQQMAPPIQQQKIQTAPTPSRNINTQRQGAGGVSNIVNPQKDNRKSTVSLPDATKAAKKKTDYGKEDPLKAKEAKTKKAKEEVNQAERDRKAKQVRCRSYAKGMAAGAKVGKAFGGGGGPKVGVNPLTGEAYVSGEKDAPLNFYQECMNRND